MKIVAGIFLLVSLAIVLIGGIAALQSQSDVGDTVINNSSDNYDTYTELKTNTGRAIEYGSYSIWLVLIVIFIILAIMVSAAFYAFVK